MSYLSVLFIATAISIVAACCAFTKWGNPRVFNFICFALLAALGAFCTLCRSVAPDENFAIFAYKLQSIGTQFIAPFFYLFYRDIYHYPVLGRPARAAVFAVPVLGAALLLAWPSTHLASGNFTWHASTRLLEVQRVPLTWFIDVYGLLVLLAGAALLVRYYSAAKPKSLFHLVIFLLPALLMVAGRLAGMGDILPLYDIPVLTTIAASAMLAVYTLLFYHSRWAYSRRARILQNMKDAYLLIDAEKRYQDCNTAAAKLFSALKTLAIGDSLLDVDGLPAEVLEADCEDTSFKLGEAPNEQYIRFSRSAIISNGRERGTCFIFFDDTKNQDMLLELQQMATHDALTGLYNRGSFFKYATRDFDLCTRNKTIGSVLMIDIDHFKKVNDTYGHQTGDKVLMGIASILRSRLRHTDISGRYGGEEMTVWLPHAATEGATIISDVLRRAVEQTLFKADGEDFSVTISIGVATMNHERHTTFEQMVAEADVALYHAKREGRNQVRAYQVPQLDEPSAGTTKKGRAGGAAPATWNNFPPKSPQR